MAKLNLLVLLGGKSPEHTISLRSGRNVIDALNKDKYHILIVGIDKSGVWHYYSQDQYLDNADDNIKLTLKASDTKVFIEGDGKKIYLYNRNDNSKITSVDVVFPVLHGTYGEDGVLQGMLRAVEVPFVGVDLMTSAVGMDKDMSKRLWRDAGIPIAKFEIAEKHKPKAHKFNDLVKKLSLPIFVKPANAGSSVGVHKVTNEAEYLVALHDAFLYDRKVLIEEAITGIEVECAVLGNENPKASVIGGIRPKESFYSYDAKYIQNDGADLMIPAPIETKIASKIQKLAIKAFKCIGGEGLSRVDFFLTAKNEIIINEINTLPGFTNISMYPKLWEVSGLSYDALLDELIKLALDRHKAIKKLRVTK